MTKTATSQKSKTAGLVATRVNGSDAYDVGYRLGELSVRVRRLEDIVSEVKQGLARLEQRFDRLEQRIR